MQTSKKKRPPLAVELLETRNLLANWGVPWPNADHLTLSFAPDGTTVDGYSSNLFQTLNQQAATAGWETEILRAFQTWAVNAKINLGLVSDDGLAVGATAAIQGEAGIGDLRISAHPLVGAVGEATPYDLTAGSRAGDVVFDTSQSVGINGQGTYDLFSLALHEAGHAFGFPDSDDTSSVEYSAYQGTTPALGAGDVAAIRSLYGARTPDQYEGPSGNDTFATASLVSIPNIAADITTNNDVDLYKYTLPASSSSTVNVTVQTSGISLLTPRVTVYDSNQQLIGTAQSTNPLDGGVTLQLNNLTPGETYYFRVQSARSDVFGMGGYRLKIDSVASETWIATLDAAYDGGTAPSGANFQQGHTLNTATSLDQSMFQVDPRFDRTVAGNLQNTSDFYQVAIPATPGNQPTVLVASVTATGSSPLRPSITVYDQSGNPVTAQVLINGSGAYLVQIPGAAPQAIYSLQISATDGTNGAYLLGVDFSPTQLVVTNLVSSTVQGTANQETRTLNVDGTQLTHFVFSASAAEATVATAARLLIYDQNGDLVAGLTAQAGITVSADVFLQAGNYRIVVAAATIDGSAPSAVAYLLGYNRLTDPLDPVPVDPSTTAPPPPSLGITDGTLTSATDPYANPWTPLPGSSG